MSPEELRALLEIKQRLEEQSVKFDLEDLLRVYLRNASPKLLENNNNKYINNFYNKELLIKDYKIDKMKYNKDYEDYILINDNYGGDFIQRQQLQTSQLSNRQPFPQTSQTTINEERQRRIAEFLKPDSTEVLNFDIPYSMRENEDVILASIKRDINSIKYAENVSELVKTEAVKLALANNYIISSSTPSFLVQNKDVVLASFRLDESTLSIVSSSVLDSFGEAFKQTVLTECLSKNYVITKYSPNFLKRNFDLVLASIKNQLESINVIDITIFNESQQATIVEELIRGSYVISNVTPIELRKNEQLVWHSIKADVKSANFIDEELKNKPTIFKYLLLNDFFPLSVLEDSSIIVFEDDEILEYYLSKIQITKVNDENLEDYQKIHDRIKELIKSISRNPLTIKHFETIFGAVALNEWENYKSENTDYFMNIFNRICSALEKNKNFAFALAELKFLIKVDDVLEEDKYALINSFMDYHRIFHTSNMPNKLQALQVQRELISKLASLYSSKSKEEYMKNLISTCVLGMKPIFTINLDSPIVKKKIVETKQRATLMRLIKENNSTVVEYINNIKSRYMTSKFERINPENISELIDKMLGSIYDGNTKIENLFNEPPRFKEYTTFETVSKLINRLNSGNIQFSDMEVLRYKHYISFEDGKYVYSGDSFAEEEVDLMIGYKELTYLFNKLQGEIIKLSKNIQNYGRITEEDLKDVESVCPFADENYVFDSKIFTSKSFKIKNLEILLKSMDDMKRNIIDDTTYESIRDLLIDKGLLAYAMLRTDGSDGFGNDWNNVLARTEINPKIIAEIVGNFDKLQMLIGDIQANGKSIQRVLDYNELCRYADFKEISLLSAEVIKKLYENNSYVSSSRKEKRISVSSDLMCGMAQRTTSTVPYVAGNYGNYKYAMYDDETILTAGIDSNACFRILGNDNDFLHYCALNKNGFVLKITDENNNFIGRASGFRNGNIVYINQLRTIYDKGTSGYASEIDDIIETFKRACKNIVDISQNNPNEEKKIDFVLVTKSYTLEGTKQTIPEAVTRHIGNRPMENESENWQEFLQTNNLSESRSLGYFNTDFGGYPLICIASNGETITIDKVQKGDVSAVYTKTRSKITFEKSNEDVERKINKIIALNSFIANSDFKPYKISNNLSVALGDNWFAIVNGSELIQCFYLPFDNIAKTECETFIEQLNTTYVQNVEQKPKSL